MNFGDLAPTIYGNTLKLEQSSVSGLRDTFLDLYIRIKDNKLLIGIYHKVDDFPFDVINFPFMQSNISYAEGPKCFYSQLVRFSALCNNIKDFATRVRLTYTKLAKRGYQECDLYKKFNHFCANTEHWRQYQVSHKDLWHHVFHKAVTSVSIKDQSSVNEIIQSCSIKLFDVNNNKSPDICLDKIYLPILKKWKDQNLPKESGNQDNIVIISESLGSPIVEPTYKVTGFNNPSNFCYLNSIFQVLICILLHSNCTYNFINNTAEYRYRKFAEMFFNHKYGDGYRKSHRSRNLQTLRASLGRHMPLLNGTMQQDVHEALLAILNVLHESTRQLIIPDLDEELIADELFTSFPRYLFRLSMSEKYVCLICKESSNIDLFEDELLLSSKHKSNVNSMINEYLDSKVDKKCESDLCKCDRYHSLSRILSSPPRILRIVIKRFTNAGLKKQDEININTRINIFNVNYSLLGVIHHTGSTIKSGHYYCTVKYSTFLNINDDRVTSQQMSELKNSKTAYILFYKSDPTA
jgi:ubiquitin C-terminal hydrolase